MKATVPVLGALLLVAGNASAQSYYRTAVSKVPILPAPDMCNSGFITTWPDGSFFYPCYNVYPPFEPFNGILPDKNGKFKDGIGGNPYGYYHFPCSTGAGVPGFGPGPGGYGPGPGAYGPGPGGYGPGPGPYGPGPGGPGQGFPGQGEGMRRGFPGGYNAELQLPRPGYMMGPGYVPPPPGSMPPPGFSPGLPTPGATPGLPAPGYAPNLPAPGYPGYAPPPVRLPTPGYEPPPGAPKPVSFPVHPFARSPRDFFMWSDMLEERLIRSQRPSLVP
jgi:hypothetical protein